MKMPFTEMRRAVGGTGLGVEVRSLVLDKYCLIMVKLIK
jgi:hypothetical protein